MLRLHDTATGEIAPVVSEKTGALRMYICGPTVYGPPHLGHGRFTLVYDVLRRYAQSQGVRVRHVSNITDIDDKIINRALDEGRDWRDVAVENEELWWSAMDRMGLARPDETPHATDYIPQMVDLIAELIDKKVAYRIEAGVYLSVESVPSYGLLARQSLDSLRAGARVEITPGKKSPMDFVLWKPAKAGEPRWEAPFGSGRPGWHTECVVMSLERLGEGFELHGGGSDLRFPHHENERAQAVAAGRRFAVHWMHNGMVEVGGEKMSKSLGNDAGLQNLLAEADPRAYRLTVLQSHYRAPIEVTFDGLAAAGHALERLDALARRLDETGSAAPDLGPVPGRAAVAADELRERFCDRMDDDLDSPRAMALVFDALRAANAALDDRDLAGGRHLGARALACAEAAGLFAVRASAVPERAEQLANRREEARRARDFAAADLLRDELAAIGFQVEDTPFGPRLYKR